MVHQNNIELLEKFFRLSRLFHQNHHNVTEACGASCQGQGRVLAMLKAHPNISQKELAALLNIRSQSLGEILARLERNGCIRRAASEEDRRVLNVELTPKGREAAKRAEQYKWEAANLFECLSSEEKVILSDLVDRLTSEFEKRTVLATQQIQQEAQSAFERHHREE